MIEPGKIRIIDNKVYFEPDGIEKPKGKSITEFFQAAEKFIESKQLVIVDNVDYRIFEDGDVWLYINNLSDVTYFENNQPCKADVKDYVCVPKKATIIELL